MTAWSGQHDETAPESLAELEASLGRLAELANRPIPRDDFYAQWLAEAERLCRANGGHVWDTRQSPPKHIAPGHDATAQRPAELSQVATRNEPTPIRVAASGAGDMLLAPVVVDGQTVAVVEVSVGRVTDPATNVDAGELLAAACEIAADYELRSFRETLAGSANFWRQLAELAGEISHAESLELTEQMIVTAARALVPCERASLVRSTHTAPRMAAVSDTVSFERRSAKVRALETLARVVAIQKEAIWHGRGLPASPEELHDMIESALDEGSGRWLAAIPLAEDGGDPVAVLILEGATNEAIVDARQRAEHLVGICTAPLAGAYDHAGLPLLGVSRWLRDMFVVPLRSRWIKLAIAVVAVAVVVATLAFVPAELTVEARGQLLPVERRHVFAPADGTVSEVFVRHGAQVRQGDKLLTMRSDPLQQEAARLQGELESNAQRMRALTSARSLNEATPGEDQRAELFRISAELSQLEAVASNLRQQLAIVQAQQQQLTVTSPASGEVLTWQVEESLASRPVGHGQRLLTIADTDGEWEIALEVPAEEIAIVRQAIADSSDDQLVIFVMEASPQQEYVGTIIEVSRSARQTDADKSIVPVTVHVDRQSLTDPLPAAGIRARIACGNHALGYVWFRQLIRYAQINWF